MTMGIGLQWQKGQALPLEPRSFMVLLPLLVLVWVDALRLQPKWVRWASAVLLFGLIGTPSWKQLSHTSTLQDWASEQVSIQARSGDWVIAPEPLSWRMDLPSDVQCILACRQGCPMPNKFGGFDSKMEVARCRWSLVPIRRKETWI